MKYSNITKEFYKWAIKDNLLIDRQNFGCDKKFINSNEQIKFGPNKYPPKKITQTHLEKHFTGEKTYFYTSNAYKNNILMLCLDIDYHNEEELELNDSHLVLDYIRKEIFSNSEIYSEPSTNGLGIHGYFFVEINPVDYIDLENYRSTLKQFEQLIKDICFGKFIAKPELKGLYRTRENRGSLIKIPFISSSLGSNEKRLEELNKLKNSLFINITEIQSIVSTQCLYIPSDTIVRVQTEEVVTTTSLSKTSDTIVRVDKDNNVDGVVNPNNRMKLACIELSDELGRRPAIEELVLYYNHSKYNTGDDINGRRSERASYWIKRLGEFKLASGSYNINDYAWLTQYVTPELMAKHSKPEMKIKLSDCAIVQYIIGLHTMTKNKGNRDFGTPYNSLDRKCNDRGFGICRLKIKSVLNLLKEADTIMCIDENYGYGKGKNFSVTEKDVIIMKRTPERVALARSIKNK